MNPNLWLTPSQLEQELEISKSTQAKYRMDHKIPFSKIGGFVFYNREEIYNWLADHKIV